MTAPESTATGAPEKGTEGTGTATTDPTQTGDSLPGEGLDAEALRKELKRARDEAVKFRQRAREFGDDEQYRRAKEAVAAVEKAEQEKKSEVEKLTEKSEGLLHRATSAEQDLAKLRIALGAGVDPSQADEFAGRLRGETEDELKADADKLAKFFGSSQTTAPTRRGDPSQGAGSEQTGTTDPLQAALESRLGIPTP